MPAILHLVLPIFTAAFVLAEVKVEFHGKGLRHSSLDGKVSNDHLLFLTNVPTELACVSTCLKYNCCVAFSTSPKGPPSKMVTCRGHDSRAFSQSSTVDVPGSKTYFVRKKPPGTSWLERPCTEDGDCPDTVSNVTCFAEAGQCLCQPGYYYSHCRDDCVPDCPFEDLQPTFLTYPDLCMRKDRIQTVHNCDSAEKGQAVCRNHPQCRAMDSNWKRNKCYLRSVTALGSRWDLKPSSDCNHYQRNCA